MNLRNKIFITFSILVLVPLIIMGLVVHKVFTTSKSEEAIKNTENSVIQLNQTLDLMLADASRTTLSLLYNERLINILRDYDVSTPKNYRSYSNANTFSLFLSGLLFNKEQVHGIHVLTNNGQVLSHMDDYRVKDYINIRAQEWYNQVKEKEGDWILYPEDNPIYYQKDNNKKFVSFLRLLKDPTNKEELGVIKVDFSPEYLRQLTNQLPSNNWQISYEGQPLFEKPINKILNKCEGNKSWVKDNQTEKEYLCITNNSIKTGIQVSNAIPRKYLYREIEYFNNLLISLIIICLILSLIISYYMTNKLIKPLESLKNRIKQFQRGRGIKGHDIQSKGEISELGGAYDDMISEIDYLVGEIYELNLRSSEAEYKALQFKMDPHFIFNTLESINMTAIKNNQFEISDMISELGKLIRFRLKNDSQQIILKEEIDFTKLYVNIVKRRFGDNLNVNWYIQEHIKDYLVPKYIIQPLIENAIIHGNRSSDLDVLNIQVKIKVVRGKIVISVMDNGAGIEYETLQKLKESISNNVINTGYHSNKGRGGIALENINSRLKIIYGNNSSLSIYSNENKGTRIELIFPV